MVIYTTQRLCVCKRETGRVEGDREGERGREKGEREREKGEIEIG